MADARIDQLSTLDSSTIASTDLLPVYDVTASDTKSITKAEYDESIGTVLDNTFAIADNADNTKKVQFQVSGVTTGTTRTITVPDASTTLVGTATTQTITNKTIDPSLNSIDGDKLDITFTPTNYTPTTTGVAEASDVDDLSAHLKGIDNALAPSSTREFTVYPVFLAPNVEVGDFALAELNATQETHFTFKVPDDFSSLTECKIVVIPDTTETIAYQILTDFGQVGELYTTNSDSVSGSTAVTINVITELEAINALTGITAGDYVGMAFESDTANIRVACLQFKYQTN